MKRLSVTGRYSRIFVPVGVFLGVLIISGIIWIESGGAETTTGVKISFSIVAVLLAVCLAIIINYQRQQRAANQKYTPAANDEQDEPELLKRRLDGMIRLNELMIESQREEEIIDKTLAIISEVAGLTGVSFVPYDEWGQPLHSYIFTAAHTPAHSPWSEYLQSSEVRHRCQTCVSLHGDSENNCPLLAAPFSNFDRIACLPLKRNHRVVGVVNLYLRKDQKLSTQLNDYLQVLLNEMSLALEITRLRNQELTTLRQLQLVHNQPEELKETVEKLVSGLCEVLDFKHFRAVFKAVDPVFSGLDIRSASNPWLGSEKVTGMIDQIILEESGNHSSADIQLQTGDNGTLLVPFSLPEGSTVGALYMAGAPHSELSPHQYALIETVTNHVAILIDHELKKIDAEYRTIMQERVRLAREIHDSLAQSLAYLKLMSAQMQSQLERGDHSRLAQTLKQSHEALSEAYLETRQAIDNLRMTPRDDVEIMLTHIAQNFEQSSGLKVHLSIPGNLPQISLEVQAQLLRILQEALSNARKHSSASKVWINVREWNDHLVLDLGDDGVGFSADDIPDFSRHGLRGMHERAELIGAEFQIASQNGQGTTIHIEVPVKIQETAA